MTCSPARIPDFTRRSLFATHPSGGTSLVERGALRLEALIIHRLALGELEAAIGMGEDSTEPRLKVILDHDRGTAHI